MIKRVAAVALALVCCGAERPAESVQQYRILFGTADGRPRDWSGRVTVSGGELAAVRGWRFSAGDRAASNGEFRCRSRAGAPGLLVQVRGPESARVTVKLEGSAAPLEFGAGMPSEGQQPLTAHEGALRVERLPVETRLSEDGMQDDMPALSIGPDGTAWTAWLSYQDQGDYVVVGDGITSTRITEKGDHHAPAIAALPNGWLMAAWSRRDDSEFHVYAAFRVAGRWTAGRRMTLLAGSHIWPRLSVDGEGRVALVWQSLREGQSAIRMRVFDGRNWGVEEPVNQDGGNAWAPVALAAQRRILLAWDAYTDGAYQVHFREWPGAPERVAAGMRPSLALSPDRQPVVAWQEAGRIRLAVRESGGWRALTGDPADSLPENGRRSLQQPEIAFDAAGRLILAFRCQTYDGGEGPARWETFLTHRDGDRWTPAIAMPTSEGRSGMRAALAVDRFRAVLAWPTDHRTFPEGKYGDLDIYSARVAVIGPASGLATEPLREEIAAATAPVPRIGGVLRGDLNLRSELSPAGGGGRSLDDVYRHAIDAAGLDFALIADRQMGAGEEYNWWLSQKASDLYFMPKRFLPLYGYDRAVPPPNGGRTIVWAERGRAALSVGAEEAKGAARSGPILFPSLRRTGGLAIAQADTGWLDYNPEAEPVAALPQELLEKAWAKGFRIGAAGGPGILTCLMAGAEFTRPGILDALRRRSVYASTGGGIALEIRAARGIEIKVAAAAPIERIEIDKNGALVREAAPGAREAELAFVEEALSEGESRYQVRVRLSDGNAAWSSPVWIRKAP